MNSKLITIIAVVCILSCTSLTGCYMVNIAPLRYGLCHHQIATAAPNLFTGITWDPCK